MEVQFETHECVTENAPLTTTLCRVSLPGVRPALSGEQGLRNIDGTIANMAGVPGESHRPGSARWSEE